MIEQKETGVQCVAAPVRGRCTERLDGRLGFWDRGAIGFENAESAWPGAGVHNADRAFSVDQNAPDIDRRVCERDTVASALGVFASPDKSNAPRFKKTIVLRLPAMRATIPVEFMGRNRKQTTVHGDLHR